MLGAEAGGHSAPGSGAGFQQLQHQLRAHYKDNSAPPQAAARSCLLAGFPVNPVPIRA